MPTLKTLFFTKAGRLFTDRRLHAVGVIFAGAARFRRSHLLAISNAITAEPKQAPPNSR